MRLTLEGYYDRERVTPRILVAAIDKMASPTGPTYIVVAADDGLSYAQAAGTNGRYVVEARDVFGEGFLHYRVHYGDAKGSEQAVVHYRQKCRNHPPRGCPLNVLAADVVGLPVVRAVMLHYLATSQRSGGLRWRDITQELLEESLGKDCTKVGTIKPRGRL